MFWTHKNPSIADVNVAANDVTNPHPTPQLYVVRTNASSHRQAGEYCAKEFGGSLISNDDVSLVYDDANIHLFGDDVIAGDGDVNLFWTKAHVEYAGARFFYYVCRNNILVILVTYYSYLWATCVCVFELPSSLSLWLILFELRSIFSVSIALCGTNASMQPTMQYSDFR